MEGLPELCEVLLFPWNLHHPLTVDLELIKLFEIMDIQNPLLSLPWEQLPVVAIQLLLPLRVIFDAFVLSQISIYPSELLFKHILRVGV